METRTSPPERHSRRQRLRGATCRYWLLGLACLAFGCGWAGAAANENAIDEYQLKALVIPKLVKYVDWPASSFASTNAPIVIGILGQDPFGSKMDDAVKGDTAHDHKFTVKRLRADEEVESCHVLFVSRSEKERFQSVFNRVKGRPVLLVGDVSDFAEKGGMVALALANNNVKLEINQAVTEQAGLQISAKLLKLARIVQTQRN